MINFTKKKKKRDLSINQLSGSIPAQLSQLTSIQEL